MQFHDLFRNVYIPVIMCRDDSELSVVYENHSAILLLNPLSTGENWDLMQEGQALVSLLQMDETAFCQFHQILEENNTVTGFVVSVVTHTGNVTPVILTAHRLTFEGERYIQICVYTAEGEQSGDLSTQVLTAALELAYNAKTTDEAIDDILAFAGRYTDVSRTYIFESTSETNTSNTYEWCAPGVEPAIDTLQNLPKDEYSYDAIIQNGLAVTDDIRKLSEEDRAILEPQGIKSMALIPIFSRNTPLGYVGFDDCKKYRKWADGEVTLLLHLAELIASLLMRRDTERSLYYSLDILKTVTDHFDHIIYVEDIHTREILFANSTLAQAVSATPEELEGQSCPDVLRRFGMTVEGSTSLEELLSGADAGGQRERSWEYQEINTRKWYLMRDAIIKWIDGRDVHIGTATEITRQKEYEAQLEYFASMDVMTGVYNREWGRRLIEHILEQKGKLVQKVSLVYLDLDGLKRTNDLYGHAAGDQMILEIISQIQACIRKSDIICRWGGDEFVLIIRCAQRQTEIIMEKITASLAARNATTTQPFPLSFSYGIVELGNETEYNVDTLISLADQRMYEDKMKKRE